MTHSSNALMAQAKLESLGLDCDVIEDLFDVLDADGSDDVSEAHVMAVSLNGRTRM